MTAVERSISSRRLVVALGLALIAVLFLAASHADAQCAMCRTALESSAEGRALIGKLNLGIVLLLGAPLGVVIALAVAMAKSRRRLDSIETS
jgi:hypothetical protein